jgi:hypothetical protein
LSGDREGAQVSSVRIVATRETDRGVGSGLQAIEDLVIQLADVECEVSEALVSLEIYVWIDELHQ